MGGLQTFDLAMAGLGIRGDRPPNEIQPRLRDGIHLRWGFRRRVGFPWYGFHLFRRHHRLGIPACLGTLTQGLVVGAIGGTQLVLPKLRISSERELVLTDDFPPPGVELDLRRRRMLRVDFDPAEPVRRVVVTIGFRDDADIELRALARATPVDLARVRGRAGDVVDAELEFDLIDRLEVTGGPAAIIDVCFVPVAQDATEGWRIIADFPYPLCLPVAHGAYPCPTGPASRSAAETMALARVVYGPAARWAGADFSDLHRQLELLVRSGPSGPRMADISAPVKGATLPGDPATKPLEMPRQRPLDLVTLAAVHPAVAQMLGLYWVDEEAEPGVAYDYLLVGDWSGALPSDPQQLLGILQEEGFLNVTGVIAFDLEAVRQPPLPAPGDCGVYALPGAVHPDVTGTAVDAQNVAGLRWNLGATNAGVLPPGQPLMYHLWRADLGDAEPTEAPAEDAFSLVTDDPILVVEPDLGPGEKPERAPDWPPFPLHAIDGGLADGWYSFQVSGVDIFGRHTMNSAPASWRRWKPPPTPAPWYDTISPGADQVHPYAVRLLDKIPPPAPTAVEAYALDPDDPTVVRDKAHEAWLETLSGPERSTVIGLRVRWDWTDAHMRQAPDTREFRIYYFSLPAQPSALPDLSQAGQWEKRLAVVGWNDHVTVTKDQNGRPLRRYEIFLPTKGDTDRNGLPLTTSLARPIVYALVGVSAADDKTHTQDVAPWSGTSQARYGNEGPVAGPVRIVRVRRVPPDRPKAPADSEKVYATAADYHGDSFYTYRWTPKTNLKTHIFRALDDSLFRIDWARPRPRKVLSATDKSIFPDPADEPRWTAAKRNQVAAELNKLNTFETITAGATAAKAYYRTLSNDALRVLAGLPGNEAAFSQITVAPLDPDDPDNANRLGPDNPATFVVSPSLRAYIDTLPGESTNRYFYRAAYVDGANNRSTLSISSPPVHLPNVVPPRTPVLTSVTGGDRKINLGWASNREDDLARYVVFRTDSEEDARDVRLMTQVHTQLVTQADPSTRPAEVTWTDDPVPGLVTYYYRLVAVDDAQNASPPTEPVAARAYDHSPPMPPKWEEAAWVKVDGSGVAWPWTHSGSRLTPGVELVWSAQHTRFSCLVERRAKGQSQWSPASNWFTPAEAVRTDNRFQWSFRDYSVDPGDEYIYRLALAGSAGTLTHTGEIGASKT